jgi:hypothetical protein
LSFYYSFFYNINCSLIGGTLTSVSNSFKWSVNSDFILNKAACKAPIFDFVAALPDLLSSETFFIVSCVSLTFYSWILQDSFNFFSSLAIS